MIYELLNQPTENEIESLVKICHKNFKYKISKNEFKYLSNSKPNSRLYVARERHTIVGLYLIVENELYAGGRLASYLAISEAYRSLKMFNEFTRFVYAEINKEKVDFIYGVANENAAILHKKIGGWRVAFELNRVKLACSKSASLLSRKDVNNNCRLNNGSFKFDDFEGRKYIYLNFHGVKIVAKVWQDGGSVRLHLMRINWSSAIGCLKEVFGGVVGIAVDRDCNEIDFWAPDWVCDELESAGYEFDRIKLEVICKSLKEGRMLGVDEANSFGFGATDSF